MKTEPPINVYSERKWTVTEIPQEHPLDLSELEIFVNYTEQGNAHKGACIDTFIVPLFRLAPALLDVASKLTDQELAIDGLSPEQILEVRRLSGDHSIPKQAT